MSASTTQRRPMLKPLRCAIYTRKSSEQGLEQEFNSLDNQREAAEAYIRSQAHEGWRLLPKAYDDGGFSGGSLDRPGLQQLLADVRTGGVDVIVVYKVDRLTRSLADFAKLVELFDEHGTSFVSVTQAFNTTTSMGRLTLNVLLSFAQFEREVTGERIRDKIAASKRKGLRVGGPVPLGYVAQNKKLIPCPEEAAQVQLIFRRYLELGSLAALLQDLDQRGLLTKAYPKPDGRIRGGIRFNKSGLLHLLKNRCYIGEVIHKGRYYPGEHEAIVPADLFHAVADSLEAKSRGERSANANRDSLLKGLLYDARGHRMTPTSSRSRGPVYRYYISTCINEGRRGEAPPRFRVSAPDIEARVVGALELGADEPMARSGDLASADGPLRSLRQTLLERVQRITLHPDELHIALAENERGRAHSPIVVPWANVRHRPQRSVIAPSGEEKPVVPITPKKRARLVQGIANARLWLEELAAGTIANTDAIAAREGCSERHVRMTLNLAFLRPDLVKAAVDGTLANHEGFVASSEPPLVWR